MFLVIENSQKNMNMFRKMALNIISEYKKSQGINTAISNIMLDCLADSDLLMAILAP